MCACVYISHALCFPFMFLSFFILVCSYFYFTESCLKREKEDMELKRWEMGRIWE